MLRWPLVLLVALACALGLAACGGGGDDDDVDSVLAQTFGEPKEVGSGRLDLNVRIDAAGVGQFTAPVGLRLSGPFQSGEEREVPRFDFQLGVDSGRQNLTAGAVSTGDKGFLRLQGQAYAVSDQLFAEFKRSYTEQAKRGDGGGALSFKALGVDPRRWLRDARIAGNEKAGGADAIHITSAVDVPRFLEDLNKILSRPELAQGTGGRARELSEADRRRIARAVRSARVDVWTGEEDKILRRLNLDVTLDPRRAGAGDDAPRQGRVRFDLVVGAVNEDQRIEAPANAKPLEELLGQLGGGQIPGLGGGGSGSGSGGTGGGGGGDQGSGGTPAPNAQDSEYLECVQGAGGDVAKLQRCADLLGG
jgi:hypothetical protein